MTSSPVGTVYILKRAELAVRSCVEVALAEFALTPTQFLTLTRLRDADELSSAALAREIGVRPQSILEVIGPLERRGLIEREASPAHRRTLHIQLTTSGRKVLQQALRVASKLEAELLSALSLREIAVLQKALVKLWERAEKHDLHPGSIRARAQELMRAHLDTRLRRPGPKP
jgi:DNA-binding MarR family transcriptional regulator